MSEQRREVDFRHLVTGIDHVVDQGMGTLVDEEKAVRDVANAVLQGLGEQLNITGARVYRKASKSHYRLIDAFPEGAGANRGLLVAADYPPIELANCNRVIYMPQGDPRTDLELEEKLGVSEFAAIEIGAEAYVVAFDIGKDVDSEDLVYALAVLRHSINDRLRSERIADVLAEARRIQTSILPRRVPKFGVFDLAARSEPVDVVGGDFYDFIPIGDNNLGTAIADSSGHGLAAAMQVRDIHMGLRMGLSQDFKIARTVERMNRIIHHGALTSRFVSLFYGELDHTGLFIYVNAGHPPPLFVNDDGKVRQLKANGPVLGPLADAKYEWGFVNLKPGCSVVMCTDGILEAQQGGTGQEFGQERLVSTVLEWQQRSASEIVHRIFSQVDDFLDGAPLADDRTVVVVKHPRSAEEGA